MITAVATKDMVLLSLQEHLNAIGARFTDFCNNDNKSERIKLITDIHHIALDVRNYIQQLLNKETSPLPPKLALNHKEASPNFDLFYLNLDQAYKRLFLTNCEQKEIYRFKETKNYSDAEIEKHLLAAQKRWLMYLEIMGRIASDLAIYALHLPVDYLEPYALEQARILTGE